MPKVKLDVPYFVWRDGRPRWSPGPKLRAAGWKGRDLKDDAGSWLPFEAALEAARQLNQEVAGGGDRRVKRIAPARARTVADLLEAYLASRDFARLRPSTQREYRWKVDIICWRPRNRTRPDARRVPEPFATAPAAAIGAIEVRAFFEYLEAARGLASARAAIMVLSAAWRFGRLSPDWRLSTNPCHALRLPKPVERVRIATDAEIRALVAAADAAGLWSIGDAVYLGLFCGQRQGDILRLCDRANRPLAERVAEGEPIRFVQSKTGARVSIFAAPQLVARLAEAETRRRGLKVVPEAVLCCETTGAAWGQSHFQHAFARLRADAAEGCPSLSSLNYQDLRDTAVTWLARAGATIPEIAAITGHSLKSIYTVLRHYLAIDEALAKEAVRKLVDWIEREGMRL